MRQLATYPPGPEYETTVHGDYVRHLVEQAGGAVDFDVGSRRLPLRDDQMFWEGRIPLDLEV
jgi:hypothetical protein